MLEICLMIKPMEKLGKNEPYEHGELNKPKMELLIEHDIIGRKFLLLSQEYEHKLWVCIVTMIYYHEKKVIQEPGHMKFICSINDYQHE